jgi:hypothetical protein
MVPTQECFNLGQQRDIAHGVFLMANKESPETNPWVSGWLDCACPRLCL